VSYRETIKKTFALKISFKEAFVNHMFGSFTIPIMPVEKHKVVHITLSMSQPSYSKCMQTLSHSVLSPLSDGTRAFRFLLSHLW